MLLRCHCQRSLRLPYFHRLYTGHVPLEKLFLASSALMAGDDMCHDHHGPRTRYLDLDAENTLESGIPMGPANTTYARIITARGKSNVEQMSKVLTRLPVSMLWLSQ